ncbi:hypothetical protein [Streptomyces sp. SCSIO ZS0520]|uniref:hypothetical protein n=1 Tax=Streptomyces sp. SCSIO ZS0520 TaxID=2892996 RepID=UPI0021DA9A78|nr:hypothetical protein [Streptomyces sp. SCSIO ZS0520]
MATSAAAARASPAASAALRFCRTGPGTRSLPPRTRSGANGGTALVGGTAPDAGVLPYADERVEERAMSEEEEEEEGEKEPDEGEEREEGEEGEEAGEGAEEGKNWDMGNRRSPEGIAWVPTLRQIVRTR